VAVASFDDFCVSICGLMGVEPPPLKPDSSRDVDFTITYREVSLVLTGVQR
jgi:hypothetical protein